VCLGVLAAGTYQTEVFRPALAYTVPTGWRNDEDLPGNFLLYRLQDDMSVAGGSYLGIYRNVAAAAINCLEQPQPGVGQTPQALIRWIQSIPGLVESSPTPVTVGGLTGYQIDVQVAKGDEVCTFDGGAAHGTPLITGGGVSSLHHVAAFDIDVRLIILGWKTGNVTLEITSAKELFPAGAYAALVQPILDSMRFGA
jgi:hypothetical protein